MFHDSPVSDPASSNEQQTLFRIVAIYDSATGSADAARASFVVARELGEEVTIDRSSWDVESLKSSTVCLFAAGEAARADMIVIALGTKTPPESLKEWIELWERKRTPSGGLLALIPSDSEALGSGLEEYLYETAVTARMDFLCRKQNRY